MMKKGYILIVTTIIIAVMLSGLLYATNLWLRTHSLELNEISQREIALYVAQYGINQMIYNLNTGSSYSNGQSINGTTPSGYAYKATYYTDDTFGGTAYIKGEGTVGGFTRVVYVSIQNSATSEAFKFNLYTGTGGFTKTNTNYSGITFYNTTYGSNYYYNQNSATLPKPDWDKYTNSSNYPPNTFVQIDTNRNYTFNMNSSVYQNKVIFINYTGTNANRTLTMNFSNITSSITMTVLTNFPKVQININNSTSATWYPVNYDGNRDYPLFIHIPKVGSGNVNINLDYLLTDTQTIAFQGLFYSSSPVSIEYGGTYWGFLKIKGELIAQSLTTDWDYLEPIDLNNDGVLTTETIFEYSKNYYVFPPPYFATPSGFSYLVGSYREEY
ncbi:MAG: hypothetical protein QXE51_06360 [Nitrososphaeria archaeon]